MDKIFIISQKKRGNDTSTAKEQHLPRPAYSWIINTPVADASGEVQTGLLQVGLKTGLGGGPSTLWTDVWRLVFMDPLVSSHGARVWQHHRWRALCTCLPQRGKIHKDELVPGKFSCTNTHTHTLCSYNYDILNWQ